MAASDEPPSFSSSSHGRNSTQKPLPLVDAILHETQYLYSLVLLVVFISCAAWYSIYNAKKNGELGQQPNLKGPGGKPLPTTKRKIKEDAERKIGPKFGPVAKNVFRYLATVVFLCYVATGASMFIHAFWHEDPNKWSREGLPWAGEYSLVRRLILNISKC